MIEFKKYSSIENSFNQEYIGYLMAERNKLFAEPIPYSDGLKVLIEEGEAYVTENRLTNVVSHIGEVHLPKDFGKVMGLFSKDSLDDFLKEHGGSCAALNKCEQKSFNKIFVSSLPPIVILHSAFYILHSTLHKGRDRTGHALYVVPT